MAETKSLYVMISRTDTGVGKLIRRLSRYPYNHVSLSLDPTFKTWVSFARYVQNVPLYGGFIVEPAERFLAKGERIDVRIFRLDIPEEQHGRLERLFSMASQADGELLYNTFDVLAAAVGGRFAVPNAYTCLGFACAVLELPFTTIKEMDEHLAPHLCYEGDLGKLVTDSGHRNDRYFTRIGFARATWLTVRHLAKLSGRALRPSFPDTVGQIHS